MFGSGLLFFLLLALPYFSPVKAQAPQLEWVAALGTPRIDDARRLATDAAGNVYVAGVFSDTLDFDPSPAVAELAGETSLYLAKYDVAGNYVWAIGIHSTLDVVVTDVYIHTDGSIYLTGSITGTTDFDPTAGLAEVGSGGLQDIFLAKYDSDGKYLWAINMPGAGVDGGTAITTDETDHVYVTGFMRSKVHFDTAGVGGLLTSAGNSDVFVARYDANGHYRWAIRMGGLFDETGHGIQVAGGHVYICGYSRGSGDYDPDPADSAMLINKGGRDIFLAKYDTTGNYVWAKNFGGTADDLGSALALDNAGQVYITGYFLGVADFDADTAIKTELTSFGGQDIFLASYATADGSLTWAKQIGGVKSERATVLYLEGNTLYMGGEFQEEIDMDPSAGVSKLISAGLRDGFAAAYDLTGNHLWSLRIGGPENEQVTGIAPGGQGRVLVCGIYSGTAEFATTPVAIVRTSEGATDLFFASYRTGCTVNTATTLSGNTLSSSQVNADYQWIRCDNGNQPIAGAIGRSFTATTNGSYAVIVTQGSCTDTSACVVISSLGIGHTLEVPVMRLSPNPVATLLAVDLTQATAVEVYSSTGKLVLHLPAAESHHIDVSAYAPGIYLLKAAGTIAKFVKQ